MYHAENSHEPIIPMEDFEAVQQVRQERANIYSHPSDRSIIYPFRGKLVCQGCGKHYLRKTVRRGPAWICKTFNTKGKAFCPTSKAIPEETLMTVTAEMLGINTFDEAVFLEHVERIEIASKNQLTYIFKDGTSVSTVWQDRSRRESWTTDKREAARQNAMQRELPEREPDGRFKPKRGE